MLTEDEKLEMYFEEALSWLDPVKVEKSLQACVDALILGRKVRLFSSELCKDPRNYDVWKQRVRTNVRDIMTFHLNKSREVHTNELRLLKRYITESDRCSHSQNTQDPEENQAQVNNSQV